MRQQIVEAIQESLEQITIANGYSSNIGLNVFEWLTEVLDQNELPAVTFRDAGVEVVVYDTFQVKKKIVLDIELIVKETKNSVAAKSLRSMINDVLKNMKIFRDTRNDLIYNMIELGSDATLNQSSRTLAGALLKFELYYITNSYAE